MWPSLWLQCRIRQPKLGYIIQFVPCCGGTSPTELHLLLVGRASSDTVKAVDLKLGGCICVENKDQEVAPFEVVVSNKFFPSITELDLRISILCLENIKMECPSRCRWITSMDDPLFELVAVFFNDPCRKLYLSGENTSALIIMPKDIPPEKQVMLMNVKPFYKLPR